MKMQKTQSFYAGSENTVLGFQVMQKAKKEMAESGKTSGRKSLYSGDTKLNQIRIEDKRQRARERAQKIIGDAWDLDRATDRERDLHQENVRRLQDDLKDKKEAISQIRAQEDQLRQGYGVAADSQEQRDAELLVRAQERDMCPGEDRFTEEEEKRLAEIYENGLTDYQKALLDHHGEIKSYLRDAEKIKGQIQGENAMVRGIRLERLKYSPMTEASDTAEQIMDAASDDILGMLADQSREHLDEEQKKRKEQGEKLEEKRKEEEQIREKRKEREEETEELTEEVLDGEDVTQQADQELEDAQRKVQEMLDQLGLVAEDIKGSSVDTVL